LGIDCDRNGRAVLKMTFAFPPASPAQALETKRTRYKPPSQIKSDSLRALVSATGRGALDASQYTLLSGSDHCKGQQMESPPRGAP